MKPSVISLEEPINEVISVVEKDIRDSGGKIEVTRPLADVYANLPTLKQVLANLISNGLKFMPPGRVPALFIYTTSGSKWVRIWIKDNGIGIAAEHHEKIFGLFQRLHDS